MTKVNRTIVYGLFIAIVGVAISTPAVVAFAPAYLQHSNNSCEALHLWIISNYPSLPSTDQYKSIPLTAEEKENFFYHTYLLEDKNLPEGHESEYMDLHKIAVVKHPYVPVDIGCALVYWEMRSVLQQQIEARSVWDTYASQVAPAMCRREKAELREKAGVRPGEELPPWAMFEGEECSRTPRGAARGQCKNPDDNSDFDIVTGRACVAEAKNL
jgi:hypothetical protein